MLHIFLFDIIRYIEVTSTYTVWYTFISRRTLSQNNKVHSPFRALLLFVLHSSAFVLRPYSLMAIYWRSRWSPRISITRSCKLSRRCDKTRAPGGSSEILTLAEGRSGGVHGLSLVRGIWLIALMQLISGAVDDNATRVGWLASLLNN